jgi:CO/xanthine dehydrogenase FAD-binding subunit
MANIVEYHRPSSVDEVITTLAAPGERKVILGGGTRINASVDPTPIAVVDLQATGLSSIEVVDGDLRVGATTTINELANNVQLPELLMRLSVRELPSTLRTLATVGGLVAVGDPESELLAGLLAHEAAVELVDEQGVEARPLEVVLDEGIGSRLITSITFAASGSGAAARTGRTPMDRPIVAAVGRKTNQGALRVAMCGVADHPVLVEDIDALEPPEDFRGTSAYRKHLAGILADRVKEQLK